VPITDLQVASAQCDATGRLEALRVRERRIGVGARAQGVREADHVHQSEIDEIVRTDGHREARGEIPDEGTHPEQSESIRGHQWQSALVARYLMRERIRSNQRQSETILSHPKPSEAIRSNPKLSEAIRSNQNQKQSEAIRSNRRCTQAGQRTRRGG